MFGQICRSLNIQPRLFSLMMVSSVYLYYQLLSQTYKVKDIVHHHVLASEVSTHSATSQILP